MSLLIFIYYHWMNSSEMNLFFFYIQYEPNIHTYDSDECFDPVQTHQTQIQIQTQYILFVYNKKKKESAEMRI